MKGVRFSREAVVELKRAIRTYETRLEGRGSRFEKALESTADLIGRFPLIGTPYHGVYRKRVVQGFDHLVFYIDYPGYIWIQAVHHGHRKPDTWLDRELPSNTDGIE